VTVKLLYIDPGSGSLFLQMLFAGLAGAAFTLSNGWKRVRGFFASRKSESTETAP